MEDSNVSPSKLKEIDDSPSKLKDIDDPPHLNKDKDDDSIFVEKNKITHNPTDSPESVETPKSPHLPQGANLKRSQKSVQFMERIKSIEEMEKRNSTNFHDQKRSAREKRPSGDHKARSFNHERRERSTNEKRDSTCDRRESSTYDRRKSSTNMQKTATDDQIKTIEPSQIKTLEPSQIKKHSASHSSIYPLPIDNTSSSPPKNFESIRERFREVISNDAGFMNILSKMRQKHGYSPPSPKIPNSDIAGSSSPPITDGISTINHFNFYQTLIVLLNRFKLKLKKNLLNNSHTLLSNM